MFTLAQFVTSVCAPLLCFGGTKDNSDLFLPRNVMSSQEVIDFIQSKISQRDENGELRLLSSIVEEVSPRTEDEWSAQTSFSLRPEPESIVH